MQENPAAAAAKLADIFSASRRLKSAILLPSSRRCMPTIQSGVLRLSNEMTGSGRIGGLHVIEQGHEAEIHVQLLMTVEQGFARIVGHEIDFYLLIAAEHDDILDDTRRRLAREAGQLETVAVQMNGMYVVAGVAHLQPIASA